MHKHSEHTWYENVRHYTKLLTSIQSVSPGKGECQVSGAILMLLHEDMEKRTYTQVGFDSIENDPYERQNVYAFLKGKSPATIVLMGHFDTVDIQDYGELEADACDPIALWEKREQLGPTLAETDPNDWMFGRGALDMKSGVAVNIALMHYFARYAPDIPLSVLFLATPDEENESAGVLQAVHLLTRLREQYHLNYIGVINTDCTTALYDGDPHRYIYTGTVGKLLPSFLCIGRESHVGTSFNGFDANLLAAELIRTLSMNDELCDVAHGQITAPPVTLRATDLKTHYNTQLPLTTYFYLNVLTFKTTPETLLERLRHYSESSLKEVLARVDKTEVHWRAIGNVQEQSAQPRTGIVLTYAELYQEMIQRLGEQQVTSELHTEWERHPTTLDTRERSLHLVHKLWTLSGRQGPAVVLYYSPPYYPHVSATPGLLQDAITDIITAHPEIPLVQQEYFPYLSDLSYLRLDADVDPSVLKANMPIWKEPTEQGTRGYYLPFEAIEKLNIPVVNFGVYGQGAHQRNEAVLMSYSFGTLPELICETIERLARRL